MVAVEGKRPHKVTSLQSFNCLVENFHRPFWWLGLEPNTGIKAAKQCDACGAVSWQTHLNKDTGTKCASFSL